MSTVGHRKQKCYVLTCSKSEYSQELLLGSSVNNLVTQHLWQDMWFLLWCCWRCSSSVMWWCRMQWPWKWRHVGNYTPSNTASHPRRPGSLSCLLPASDLCGLFSVLSCGLILCFVWLLQVSDLLLVNSSTRWGLVVGVRECGNKYTSYINNRHCFH